MKALKGSDSSGTLAAGCPVHLRSGLAALIINMEDEANDAEIAELVKWRAFKKVSDIVKADPQRMARLLGIRHSIEGDMMELPDAAMNDPARMVLYESQGAAPVVRSPYDLTAAGGHAGIVDEALVQKSESDWVAVSNPQAITDARVAPRATAMTDEYLLCMVDRPPSEKAHFLANPCNGVTPPHEIFVSDFFQLRSGAPTSLVASSEGC